MSTAIVEPQIVNTLLAVDFGLTTLQLAPGPGEQSGWEFGFNLIPQSVPGYEDFYMYLHFFDRTSPGVLTVTKPYRLHVTVLSCPRGGNIYDDPEVQLTLMHSVIAEIDMKLRQVFYRQADPRIAYARLTNIVGGEFAATRRAHFLPR